MPTTSVPVFAGSGFENPILSIDLALRSFALVLGGRETRARTPYPPSVRARMDAHSIRSAAKENHRFATFPLLFWFAGRG
jgi:hypothetical protein